MPANIYDLVAPLTHRYGEDIIQDALLRTWEKRPALLEQPSIETVMYLTTAAKNIHIDRLRATAAELDHIAAAFDPWAHEPPVDTQLEMDEYEQAVAEISTRPVCRQRKDQLLTKLRRGYVA